jgi:hypothetical protein
MKFTKEVKDKWVNALESGVYKKGINYLKNNDEYCCMGVLADIMDGIDIDEAEDEIVCHSGEQKGYFHGGLGLKSSVVATLAKLNDNNYREDKIFENMIPHIKELEVEV